MRKFSSLEGYFGKQVKLNVSTSLYVGLYLLLHHLFVLRELAHRHE